MWTDELWCRLRSGEIANIDQVAGISASRVDGGRADGTRTYDIRCAGGFSFRVLPDRGFDIGYAWAFGTPISWTSKVGEVGPADEVVDPAWINRFGGGLLTTCGIDNVGLPSEGIGQHGSFSFLRATEVVVRREWRKTTGPAGTEHDELAIVANAVLDDVHPLKRHLRVHRTITSFVGRAELRVIDIIENLGFRPEPAPILYHVNFGSPFWSPGTKLTMSPPALAIAARDEQSETRLCSWDSAPSVSPNAHECVFEHTFAPTVNRPAAHLVSPATGLRATMSWTGDTLPRLHQWVHPGAGIGALGIEPANASLLGVAVDREAGRLALLQPGETRTTGFDLMVDRNET